MGFCLLLQVDPDAIRQLGDEKHSVRHRAAEQLKHLPYEYAGELRNLIPGEADPERRGRLEDVVRHLASKEAEALLAEGALYKALLKTAEAEGATDPTEAVSEKSVAARETLGEIWDQLDSPGCKIVFPDSHRALVRCHGLYMVRPLLSSVDGPHSYAAVYYLTHWIEKVDLVPILKAQLQGEEERRFHAYCHMLGHFGSPAAIEALRSVKNDGHRSAELRECAFDVLRNTRAYPESCYPDVIERLVREVAGDEEVEGQRATSALKEHPPYIARQLRELAMVMTDPVRRQRIEAIIGHLESKL